jgi:hypothetical protein
MAADPDGSRRLGLRVDGGDQCVGELCGHLAVSVENERRLQQTWPTA